MVLGFILNCPVFYNSGLKWRWDGVGFASLGHIRSCLETPITRTCHNCSGGYCWLLGVLLDTLQCIVQPPETVHLAQNVSNAEIQTPHVRATY